MEVTTQKAAKPAPANAVPGGIEVGIQGVRFIKQGLPAHLEEELVNSALATGMKTAQEENV